MKTTILWGKKVKTPWKWLGSITWRRIQYSIGDIKWRYEIGCQWVYMWMWRDTVATPKKHPPNILYIDISLIPFEIVAYMVLCVCFFSGSYYNVRGVVQKWETPQNGMFSWWTWWLTLGFWDNYIYIYICYVYVKIRCACACCFCLLSSTAKITPLCR